MELAANDAIFDALAHHQRRRLLLELLHYDTQPVPELAGEDRELLDADEDLLREVLAGSGGPPPWDESRVLLYRVHLPVLAELGFITWHRDAHLVTRGRRFDDVKPLLELMAEREPDRLAAGGGVSLRK